MNSETGMPDIFSIVFDIEIPWHLARKYYPDCITDSEGSEKGQYAVIPFPSVYKGDRGLKLVGIPDEDFWSLFENTEDFLMECHGCTLEYGEDITEDFVPTSVRARTRDGGLAEFFFAINTLSHPERADDCNYSTITKYGKVFIKAMDCTVTVNGRILRHDEDAEIYVMDEFNRIHPHKEGE